MNKGNIAWKMLLGNLVVLFFSLLVDGAMIYGGIEYSDESVKKRDNLQATIIKLRSQAKQQEEQSRLLTTVLPKHAALQRMGVLGGEHRMAWVESLKEAEQVLKLPAPIRFKLEPTRLSTLASSMPPSQDLQLFSSSMEVNFGLLHEGDLLDLIAFLEKKSVGLFQVKKCQLQAVATDPAQSTRFKAGVNLQGGCLLEWFSFQAKDGNTQ